MTTTKSARQEAMTLAQFDAAVDQHAGVPQKFADTVRTLREVRAKAAALQARRDEVFKVLTSHYERNDCILAQTDVGVGETRVLRRHPDKVLAPKLSVPSAVLKKASPTLWEQCKRPTPYVAVKAPADTPDVAVDSLPPVPNGRKLMDTVWAYDWFKEPLADLKRAEDDAVHALKKIGANNGWDGLPIEFSDGWQVSLARMQYDSEKLRLLAPETFAALAVESTPTRAGHVYLAVYQGDQGGEYPFEGE